MIILIEKETDIQKLQKATDNNKDNHIKNRDIYTGKYRSSSRASDVANAQNKFQLKKDSVSKGLRIFLNKDTNRIYKKLPDKEKFEDFQEYIITDLVWSFKTGYTLTLENPNDKNDKIIWTEKSNKPQSGTSYINLLNKLYWKKNKNKKLLNSYLLLNKPIEGMYYSIANLIAILVDQYNINPNSNANTNLSVTQEELSKFIISKQVLESKDPTFIVKTIFYLLKENNNKPEHPFTLDILLDKNNNIISREEILKRIEIWKETGTLSGKSNSKGKSKNLSKSEIMLMARLTGDGEDKAKELLNIETSLNDRNKLLYDYIETKISNYNNISIY